MLYTNQGGVRWFSEEPEKGVVTICHQLLGRTFQLLGMAVTALLSIGIHIYSVRFPIERSQVGQTGHCDPSPEVL